VEETRTNGLDATAAATLTIAAGSGWQAVGDRQWAAGSGRHAVGGRQRAAGSGRQAMGSFEKALDWSARPACRG